MRALPTAIALLLLTGAFAPSLAYADDDARRAAEHFALAESAEKREDWETAILEYKQAYALKPHPSVLYNIARNYERLEDWANAAEYYQRYLDDSGDASDRAKVEKKISVLRQRAAASRPRPRPGSGRLVVRSNVEGAKVTIDNVPLGVTPFEAELPAGPHQVAISAPGYATAYRDVDVPAGGTEEIRERLERIGGEGDPGSDGTDGVPKRTHWVLGMAYGLDVVTENAPLRYLFNLGVRSPSLRFEGNVFLGVLGRNNTGLGVDGRMYLATSAVWRPFIRVGATLGKATFGFDELRTYGFEGGGGMMIVGTKAPNDRVAIEYIVQATAVTTFGGHEDDPMTDGDDDNVVVPFAVAIDFGIAVRF